MREYIIAKYLRLSIDDAVTESLSIPHQHRLLDEYIESMDVQGVTVLEFVDNGYTGTNFERPAVQELLTLVQSGGVDCVLCKDFSRLGRNAVETGYFVDQVFPLYQTRFIAVDDGFDSDDYKEDTGGINIAFKHIIHEQYSRDLSIKVKSAKRLQMARGENIVKNAIYGYRKGTSGRWEIDEPAAEVVRLIYGLALDGFTPAKIRDLLCAEKIPTPREYQSIQRGADMSPSCMWTARMVTHTLSNEQYTGMYVSGKQVSKAIGSHSKIHTDKSEWIKIPDRHPPIIDTQMFETVQDLMEKYRRGKIKRKPREYLLRGKVACGCCRYALSYDAIDDPVFRCHHTHAAPSAECHKMKVNVRELDEAVLHLVEKQLQVVLNCGSLSEVRKKDTCERNIAECEKLVQDCIEQRRRVYEQFAENEIDKDAWLVMKSMCGERLEKLDRQLTALKAERHSAQAKHRTAAIAKELVDRPASPRELVEALVGKIYVYPDNQVEIEWLIADFATQYKSEQ